MIAPILAPPRPRVAGSRPEPIPSIRGVVHSALTNPQPRGPAAERRRLARYPFPYPVYLTPLSDEGRADEETFIVLGRHLSECGLDFYYSEPVTHRRLVASFERGQRISLVLELTWCRFNRRGWYTNGGRFVGVVPAVHHASDFGNHRMRWQFPISATSCLRELRGNGAQS